MGRWLLIQDKEVGLMPDYEDMILQRQELIEIWEDEPDSSLCPIGHCWWDDIPEDEFYVNILK